MGKATMAQRCEIIFSPKEGAEPKRTSAQVFVKVVKLHNVDIGEVSVKGSRLFFETTDEAAIQAVLNAIQPLVGNAKRA